MITENLGKIAITPKGDWVAGTYERLDMVTDAGSSYISLKDNNVSALNTADWMLVAGKGDAFEYTDFTPEQLETLKVKGDTGDPFLYSDFTPEQIEALKVKGDAFEYSDFTAEQITILQQPAIDAAVTANTAATNANTKAGLADTAAVLANTKAGLANDAATNANTKAGLANDAATAANDAAEAVAPSVINNEEVQAEVYNVLNARIAALEAIIAAGVYNYIQADTLIGVNSLQYKGAKLILTGTAAPAIVPDFVGQVFVNTTGGVTYMAKGIASAADWKQTSN